MFLDRFLLRIVEKTSKINVVFKWFWKGKGADNENRKVCYVGKRVDKVPILRDLAKKR